MQPAKRGSQPPRGREYNKATSKPAFWKNGKMPKIASSPIRKFIVLSKEACANVVFVVFPYALIFRIRCYELQVLAVMQMRRRPGYWKARDGKLK